MTYLVAFYSTTNVCANISGLKWIVEQHVSLLFCKLTIFHTCTHDMEPCYVCVCVCVCVCVYVYIQGVPGGKVNILGGGSMDYSE